MLLNAKKSFLHLIFALAIIGSAVFISRVFSYNDTITHPFLAEQSARLFNQNFGNKLTDQQINWIKQGVVEEDTPIRWMNHFYSPKNGLGLFGFASAKDWAESSIEQMFYPKGNQTFQKAVSAYAKGNEKEAFIALGHVIHLIEDMTVPAHTRMDAHAEGDSYESWAKDNGNKTFDNLNIQKFNSLGGYFDSLATYSSEYFLSKDTVSFGELAKKDTFIKKINDSESIECVLGNINDDNFCLIVVRRGLNKTDYFIDVPLVNSDYYLLLAPKAISYGAGVIDLFLKTAEIEKQKNSERNWFEKLTAGLGILDVDTEPQLSPSPTPQHPALAGVTGLAPQPSPSPTTRPISPIRQIGLIPTPQLSPLPTPQQSKLATGQAPIPTPSPVVQLGLLPYAGFGGGGAPVGNDQIPITNEPTPTSEPSPPPTPEPTPSPIPTPFPSPQPLDVVINEVAWAGTGNQTSQDEWIELYNNADYDIDFDAGEWILYSETDADGPYINLTGTIASKSFYLIERTGDNTISDIPADLFSSFGNGLNDRGESLILSYAQPQAGQASTTIDQTALCNGRYNWPPCGDYSYRTMERIDSEITGTDHPNWAINNQLIMNGIGSKDNLIYGTPKTRNSSSYLIAKGQSNISSDITLKKSKSPYIVNNQNQIFKGDAVLTIEPGVVIKFNNDAGLKFEENSKIISQGTVEEPIVFTSFFDDEYGGDTNNDAASSIPYPGAWFGVKIESTAADSIFDYNIFRYGGKYYSGWGIMISSGMANLNIVGSSPPVNNSIFENSKVYGLSLINSSSTVSNNIIRNNKGEDPSNSGCGVFICRGGTLFQNNSIIQNKRGLHLSDTAKAVIDSNHFEANAGEAIYSYGAIGKLTNNTGSNNNLNAIMLNGRITETDMTLVLKPNPLPYYIWGYEGVTVIASSTLEIGAGVVLTGSKITYTSSMAVYGNLMIKGNTPDDVIFTSIYDDGNNPLTPGQWGGVVMKPGSYSNISGATFKYADIALTYQNSPINLSNVRFISNINAVIADADSVVENTSTTTPSGLW